MRRGAGQEHRMMMSVWWRSRGADMTQVGEMTEPGVKEPIPSDYVEMRFGPRWTYISCVRKFVASFFMIGLSDKERAEQISMAASELLENAVKYASEEEGYLKISIAKGDNSVDV